MRTKSIDLGDDVGKPENTLPYVSMCTGYS